METNTNGRKPIEEVSSSTEQLANQKSIANLTSVDNIQNEQINVDENKYNYFNYTQSETLLKNQIHSIANVRTDTQERNIFSEHNLNHPCIDRFQVNLSGQDRGGADGGEADNDYTDAEVQMRNQQDILKILEDEDAHLGLGGAPGLAGPPGMADAPGMVDPPLMADSPLMGVHSGESLLGNAGDAENGKNDSMEIGGEAPKGGLLKEGEVNEDPLARSSHHEVACSGEEHPAGGAPTATEAGAAEGVAAGVAVAGADPTQGGGQPPSHIHAPEEKAEIDVILSRFRGKDGGKDGGKDKSAERCRSKYKDKFLRLFRKAACPNQVKDQPTGMNEVTPVKEGVGGRRRASSTEGSSGGPYIQHYLSGSFNEYNRGHWKGGFHERGFQVRDFQQGNFHQGTPSGAHIPMQIPTGAMQRGVENLGEEPPFGRKKQSSVDPFEGKKQSSVAPFEGKEQSSVAPFWRKSQHVVPPLRESRTCSIKTDDHLTRGLPNEYTAGAYLEAHKGGIETLAAMGAVGAMEAVGPYSPGERPPRGGEQKLSCESIARKIYSLEKVKSFMSNNTFLKDKKDLLQKRRQLSKEVNFFCRHYNVLMCFFLYIICFAFVTASICYDSWKVHQMELKSKSTQKAVHIDIGATTIRRVEKVSKQNGDVTLSIDKEQTMESLIANEICKPVTKEELEKLLTFLASNNMLRDEQNPVDPTKGELTDEFLVDALKNPAHVGLLNDQKLVLTRKHIFGPTIYNLECKFLAKIKKAGTYHTILLYAILIFLLIPICLLFHILLNYKKGKNVLLVKYISFLFVNVALITMISSLFSVNRAYNIPLCVMHDGSSDICEDGTSIHLMRSSIILLIFSNLFFCKFVHFVRKEGASPSGSIV
ncbi:hypothetical protein PVBG_01181 [Plasmodium vivax Brazil I]|uniref:Uncharacterized protein n=1 Tax=Plasmodium vivax (strain Brazil I) TaxID=1033975 RepID=A0A0J9SS78_PLAV1|nr:hypothetical protein PVBG_01181 [Plasmodium vivax Brazil I]